MIICMLEMQVVPACPIFGYLLYGIPLDQNLDATTPSEVAPLTSSIYSPAPSLRHYCSVHVLPCDGMRMGLWALDLFPLRLHAVHLLP